MAKIATQRILMLRTGATEWVDSGRLQGSTDLPLSARGVEQMSREVASLGRPPLSAIVCGPDEASLASAQALAEVSGAKVVSIQELEEVHFGLWEGILRSELEGRFCRAGRQWDDDPASVTPPEGECLDAFADRLLPALKRAINKLGGRRGVSSVARMGGEGVGIVLRPIADAVVRCVLAGRPSCELCSFIEPRPQPQWFEVKPDQSWELVVGSGREPSVSAA
jgi:broad specificity phosphatase PhoE